jgi:hypothetical protein
MAATGILFADYAKHSKPKRLYLDSSFAILLLYYELNQSNPSVLRPKHTEAYKFYQALAADRVDLVGSVVTYGEVLHYYTFRYTGGMYDLAKAHLASLSVNQTNGTDSYKLFNRKYPAACSLAWKTISHRVGAVEYFFDQHKIGLRSPFPSPQLTNITRDVVNYASILKDAYVAIESMDSIHLSMSHYLDSDAVATSDLGFLTADPFKVYYCT